MAGVPYPWRVFMGKAVMSKMTEMAKSGRQGDNPIVVLRDRFVFNRRTGAFFSISPEGAFILRATWRGLDRNEIEKEVMAEFGVSAAVAMSDTERFLLRLEEMHLLPQDKRSAK